MKVNLQKQLEDLAIKKQREHFRDKLMSEGVLRQRKKDEYKKQLKIQNQTAQDMKVSRLFEARSSLNSQGYFYLNKRCI